VNTSIAHIAAEERIEISSVGVDIGSATTHLVFSTIILEKVDARYETVGRTVDYESPVMLTPFVGETEIDAQALERFVEAQYRAAGIPRATVETGALILTGVALLRHNARRIAEVFAEDMGKMVAVSAGDGMETVLAAHGSGAVERSRGLRGPLVHVDVGGGTTKIAVCRGGLVEETVAIDIGARLIVTDPAGAILRLEDSARRVGHKLGLDLRLGGSFTAHERTVLVAYLADAVLAALHRGETGVELLRGEPLSNREITAVSFSGGVAEYIYGRHDNDYDDLGRPLARELGKRILAAGIPILDSGNSGIRATAVGASQYTVQLSGSTMHISRPDVLPLRNVQIIAPPFDFEDLAAGAVADTVRQALTKFDLADQSGPIGIAVPWRGMATYDRLDEFSRGILDGLAARADAESTVVLVSDQDVGRLVGGHLCRELGVARPVVSVDCVEVSDFDFVDVGSVLPGTATVPVIIKSLVFPQLAG
jgi:ethanolamine utilization protein EutA